MLNTPRIKLAEDLELSRIVQGHWRLADWQISVEEILQHTEQLIELGITSFDHADIYGNYSCEKLFGDALQLVRSIRDEIKIITKCGIKLRSDRFPSQKIKTYDYSYDHIVSSVEYSLKNFRTDRIDLLLLHRPAPFFNPEEVARAINDLKKQGKVLYFGVSNFNPQQFGILDAYCDEKLVTNQVEISPYCLEHFNNGNIDFFLKEKIKPMAWSPLAGGKIFTPEGEKGRKLLTVLTEISEELQVNVLEKVIYAWLLNHPAQILPLIGTGKLDRVKFAVESLNITMSLEQWYRIYTASTGNELP
ncbi:MAG: aldo/keto reductase [Bacteroidetes bacterium]|nr:aldo/keto reductase [Bacteroidota bacterium]